MNQYMLNNQRLNKLIKKIYYTEKKKIGYDPSKFTVVGSPTITEDGIATGFSETNAIDTIKLLPENNSWEVSLRVIFKSRTEGTDQYFIYNSAFDKGIIIVHQSHNQDVMQFIAISSDATVYPNVNFKLYSSDKAIDGDVLDVSFKYNSETKKYLACVFKNNELWCEGFIQSDAIVRQADTGFIRLGSRSGNANYCRGSIDLSQFKITVDNQTVFDGAKYGYYTEGRTKTIWDSSQFTEVGNITTPDDYKNFLHRDNFKANTAIGDVTTQMLNGGYITLRGYQGYQSPYVQISGDTPFRLKQWVWRNNPDQGNQGYAPTSYTLYGSNDNWATSVELDYFTASAPKDATTMFTWDIDWDYINSSYEGIGYFKSYRMQGGSGHTNGTNTKYGLSITLISFDAEYDKDGYNTTTGVVTGCNTDNYITTNTSHIDFSKDFKIVAKIKTPNEISGRNYVFRKNLSNVIFSLSYTSSRFQFRYPTSANNDTSLLNFGTVEPSTEYTFTIIYKDGVVSVKEYGVSGTSYYSDTVDILYLGAGSNDSFDIFLKDFKIYSEDKLVLDGNKQVPEYDPSKFTVVGTPTITSYGVASGLDNSNYLTTLDVGVLKDKSWTIKANFINLDIKTPNTSNTLFKTGGWTAWGGISVNYISNGTGVRIVFYNRTGLSTDTNNERAWAVIDPPFIPNKINASMSFDINTGTYTAKADWGEGEVVVGTYVPTTENKQLYYINEAPTNKIQIGAGSDNTYNKNATDLSQFSITVDGKEVFTGAKKEYFVYKK